MVVAPFIDIGDRILARDLGKKAAALAVYLTLESPDEAQLSDGVRFPRESEYRTARNGLLEREIELRRLTEEVAALRRALPVGGAPPEDYVSRGDGPLRLSELFEPGKETLSYESVTGHLVALH